MHPLKQVFLFSTLMVGVVGCQHKLQRPTQPGTAPAPAKTTATAPVTKPGPGERPLFDGKTLAGWRVTDFSGSGKVTVTDGQINLGNGYMTGISYTNPVPEMNYEVSLDAKRVEGSDFFCGLTFPVGSNYCSFIVGGWGGGVVGFSSIDGEDASQNESTQYMNFVNDRWYHVRVRVLPDRIQAWIDNDSVANVETRDRRLSIRLEVESSKPLGIATWNTGAALRNIRIKSL